MAKLSIVIDWDGLKELGYTPKNFTNGCCPTMAYLLHDLIDDSLLFLSSKTEVNCVEGITETWLEHCVVKVGDESYDAGGDKAIERWDAERGGHDGWFEVSQEDFGSQVAEFFGYLDRNAVDKIRPFVKVIVVENP